MTAREIVKRLKADGWYELKGKPGSHRQFKHPEKPGRARFQITRATSLRKR